MDQVARVVVGLEAQDVVEEVLHFLDRSGRARVVATAADDRQLHEAVRQLEPDAIVAEPTIATASVGSRRVPDRRATVVAVHAARGGAGCTFVATHLAQALVKRGSSCLLVE